MSFPEKLTGIKSPITFSDFLVSESNEEIIFEIIAGLTAPQKYISSRFFYDNCGSELFEEITRLPEYYLTLTEKSILKKAATQILNEPVFKNIVELGSGDCSKISILLDTIIHGNGVEGLTYIPVDMCKAALLKSGGIVSEKYPGIRIHAILADFMKHMNLIPRVENKLICFFGSTLGNLTKTDEISFLINLKSLMDKGDQLLIGFDMVKDPKMLEEAYNDKHGITAAFNKNILLAVNHFAKTNFNPERFEHLAIYNPVHSRIEMHLKTLADVEVTSPYLDGGIFIKEGETIHTENAHKYNLEHILQLAGSAGLEIKDIYTDINQWFSLAHFQ